MFKQVEGAGMLLRRGRSLMMQARRHRRLVAAGWWAVQAIAGSMPARAEELIQHVGFVRDNCVARASMGRTEMCLSWVDFCGLGRD